VQGATTLLDDGEARIRTRDVLRGVGFFVAKIVAYAVLVGILWAGWMILDAVGIVGGNPCDVDDPYAECVDDRLP
jgi:hypothetical protein